MKEMNFMRKVNIDFARIGRRFLGGDIVMMHNNKLFHFYVNENKDGVDVLENDANYMNGEEIEIILDNSEDV